MKTTDGLYQKINGVWINTETKEIVDQSVIDKHTDGENGVGIITTTTSHLDDDEIPWPTDEPIKLN